MRPDRSAARCAGRPASSVPAQVLPAFALFPVDRLAFAQIRGGDPGHHDGEEIQDPGAEIRQIQAVLPDRESPRVASPERIDLQDRVQRQAVPGPLGAPCDRERQLFLSRCPFRSEGAEKQLQHRAGVGDQVSLQDALGEQLVRRDLGRAVRDHLGRDLIDQRPQHVRRIGWLPLHPALSPCTNPEGKSSVRLKAGRDSRDRL
ncbi:hypothetical protein [Fodinicola feengrottensis]|uniref:hypothetical protein n=1 Tax=Fodinicola feengrottensis TaxID=435914 RepID=UPI0013D5CF1E|nr:hypothetical protein [Fodinicola feengrottensis]